MKEAISFLLNFIGRRDCNAGGRHCDVEQLGARLAHTQEVAGSSPAVATGREAYPTPYNIFCQTPCRNTGSFGV